MIPSLSEYGTDKEYKTIAEWFADHPVAEKEVSLYMKKKGGKETLRYLQEYFNYPFTSRSSLLEYAEKRKWIWNDK